MLVPAERLPVLGATAFVATMPVPASPSGGQNGIPAFKFPDSSSRAAPDSVNFPADSPATKTFGKISRSFKGLIKSLNFSSIEAS